MTTHYTTEEVDSLIVNWFQREDDIHLARIQLFFEIESRYDIPSYDGKEPAKLLGALKVVNSALGAVCSFQLKAVIRSLTRGLEPDPILLQPTSTLSHVFLNKLVIIWACQENGILEESAAEAIIAKWRHQAREGLRHLEIYARNYSRPSTKTFDHVPSVLRSLEARVTFLKSIFANDPVKKSFLELMEEIKSQEGNFHKLYPSVLICSPSGSGKTTLLQHLCCESFPAAFTLFSACDDNLQEVYKPFKSLSDAFIEAQLADLSMIKGQFNDMYLARKKRQMKKMKRKENFVLKDIRKMKMNLQRMFWQHYLKAERMISSAYETEPLKYQTIGFIVALFKQLVADRANNQGLSWLELQYNIRSLAFAPMSILEGLNELKRLAVRIPLMLFVDECFLCGTVSSRRFQLLQNLSRCLKIAVIFSGTDARASDLTFSVLPRGSPSGGELKVV